MRKIVSNSPENTKKFVRDWLASLPEKNGEATIVGLYGNLGSGKTTFTKFLAQEMGVEEQVTSPTFVIEKIYETKHKYFKRLVHIDAYRLEKSIELQTLNFEDLVNNSNNLIVIEWPENVKEILPADHLKIYCTFIDENSREFKVQ